jgi:DivIVA domain-containing protein
MVTTPSRFGSRVDVTSPRTIASVEFATARRGYDRDEVRALLGNIAGEIERLHEENARLQADLEAAVAAPAPELDEATATALLGEEAARVLTAAKEAAGHITARAQETADRILHDARDEATRLREDAALDASRQRQDAAAEADAEVEAAKAEGRRMVAEARAVRERMLSDLVRRRDWGRAQLERLRDDRDRLVASFEDAGRAVDDVLSGLRDAAPEPVGIDTIEEAEAAVMAGPSDIAEAVASPTDEPPSVASMGAAERTTDEAFAADAYADAIDADVADIGDTEGREVDADVVDHRLTVSEPVAEAESPAAEQGDDEASAIALHLVDAPPTLSYAGELDEDPERRTAVDDLFARLRASAPADVAADVETIGAAEIDHGESAGADAPATPGTIDEDAAYLADRAAALHPARTSMARHLKRAITDEQNEVLDALRRKTSPKDLDALVGSAAEHAARYRNAVKADLVAAAQAGVQSVVTDGADVAADVVASLLDELGRVFLEPLRERLARAFADAGGDTVEASATLRAAYREWRAQRAEEVAEQMVLLAHGRGAFAALAPGTPIHWVVDPEGPLCPDAEDNALAGVVLASDPFPTGHCHAPAHPGCCCGIALSQG